MRCGPKPARGSPRPFKRGDVWTVLPERDMRIGHGLLGLWFVGTLLVGAFTTGVHALELPKPTSSGLATTKVAHLRDTRGGAVHALYASCKCSERIIDALVVRGARRDLPETVLGVGDFGARRSALRDAGYAFVAVSADELRTDFGIEAAPLLVVVRADGSVGYAGGYRATENGRVEVASLIERALVRPIDTPHPLFGCAVSKVLRGIVDPFGFKN